MADQPGKRIVQQDRVPDALKRKLEQSQRLSIGASGQASFEPAPASEAVVADTPQTSAPAMSAAAQPPAPSQTNQPTGDANATMYMHAGLLFALSVHGMLIPGEEVDRMIDLISYDDVEKTLAVMAKHRFMPLTLEPPPLLQTLDDIAHQGKLVFAEYAWRTTGEVSFSDFPEEKLRALNGKHRERLFEISRIMLQNRQTMNG